jgi:lysophospholipase L1-like esterase
MKISRRKVLLAVSSPALVVGILESALRLLSYPQGTFAPIFPVSGGLYPPNAVIHMTWGPIPYTVRSNSLGFRGEAIAQRKDPGTLRIVTIGDSITDGFFVDNECTWQYYLEDTLRKGLKRPAEVVNCARGGVSIDAELAVLRQFGIPLGPDLVVLTVVSNDIGEIVGQSVGRMLNPPPERRVTFGQRMAAFTLTRTAIGEASFDCYLRIRSPSYRAKRKQSAVRLDDSRYDIPGGTRFAENARIFLRRFGGTDGLVLGKSFDPYVEAAFGNYALVLKEFAGVCDRHKARLLVVYFPAYSQVYLADSPRFINERLRTKCEELRIDFLDLTDGFRGIGSGQVLHLAPLDFHPNPRGNQLFARLVAERILSIVACDGQEGARTGPRAE